MKNDRTAITLLVLVALAGILSGVTMSKQEDPDFTIRAALVVTVFPGASPQRVEELVSDKLEERIREIPEVDKLTSQSMTGVSVIQVDFHDGIRNMEPLWRKLRDKVADATPSLPEGCRPPVVNDEFGDVYGICIALTGDGYTYRELKDAADTTRDELLKLDLVGKVNLWGVQDERVYVDFSNARVASLGVSPFALARVIDAQNTIKPSGHAKVGPERVVIEPTGEFTSVDDLKGLTLRLPGQPTGIALSDIATVTRGFVDPPSKMVRYNGQPAILLAVSMAKGGNILELGRDVTARLDALQETLPVGLDFHTALNQPDYVRLALSDFGVNLLESFVFVVVVMLAFAGLRTGLVAGMLVPMAMLACLAVMPAFGVGLQRMSIASLIISLGILVDNGVVVSENILVRLASGQERGRAVTEAVRELWMPLLAASLTTIFAFLPIPFAPSKTGEYTFSLFVVISCTLLASWLLSLTMVPMLSYHLLRPRRRVQTFDSPLYRMYRASLVWALAHRVHFLVVVVAVCAASVWGFRFVPKIFFPTNERNQFLIDFWQPYGSDIRTTAGRAARLEKLLRDDAEVRDVLTFVGASGPRWYLPLHLEESSPNYAALVVRTTDIAAAKRVMPRVQELLDANFPDCRHSVKELVYGPPVGAPVQVRISGPDIATLYALRDRVAGVLDETQGVVSVWDDWGEWTKKLVVDVNQEQARRAGLSSADVALSLQTHMSGLAASTYREGDESIPIVLRSEEAIRENLGRLEGLNVYSFSGGGSVPLMQVARTSLTWEPSDIRRRNGARTITVKADIEGRFASQVLADVQPRIRELMASSDWPTGYYVEYGGEQEESGQSEEAIVQNLPLAMGLLVLVLVGQFNSIRRPIIIMLTVPPMMVGITWGMLATSAPFGFMAMLGMISLLGIIVNNAIMLIDQIEILRASGMEARDAIVVGALKRARPILMTTITTIIGMVPLSLQGGELWRPMANCIMSGLAFATLLTLLLCPVLYSLAFGLRFRGWRWNPQVLSAPDEAAR
nr:efflux RND transporter permease subunit [Desulfobaculum xiamenense]